MEVRRPMTRSLTRTQNERDTLKKILIDEKPKNIVNLLLKSQINKKLPRSLTNIPNQILSLISERANVADFLFLLKRLDQSSVSINFHSKSDEKEILSILKDIENRLIHFNDQNTNRDEFEIEMINSESAKIFRLYGGIDILKRILLLNFNYDDKNIENQSSLNIKYKCIHIINRLICLPSYGKQLVNDLMHDSDIVIQYLFSLLLEKQIRQPTCQLIESLLLHLPLLNLTTIKNLSFILENIDDEGLSCMCKIFAVTLSDLDFNENKYWNASRNASKKRNTEVLAIRDANHEILLNSPRFLHRLVNLVKKKDYAARYSNGHNELEHWIEYIDQALSDDNDDDNNMDTIDDFRLQPALNAASKLNNFVHILYTLSLLLIGKERKRVQKSLAKLKLAPALNSLFDYCIWNCKCENPQENNNTTGNANAAIVNQVRSHICPEVAVKIQLLRLIHSFCDNSEFKRVMLSKEEIQEVCNYNREAPLILKCPEESFIIDCKFRCTNEKIGLLSKIVRVIKQEPFSASFRFWLTRAIESYLRGGTQYADQLFLINRGMVEDTIQNILVVNFSRPKEVIQSSFDILGELIKFNSKGFKILSNEVQEVEKFDMFIRMINQSLVDSNMFLRALFLSIDFFHEHIDMKLIGANHLLKYFDEFDKKIKYVCRMINIINTNNLSQENISCLNTTLVILMLANKKTQLPKFLQHIKSHETSINLEFNNNNINAQQDLMNNFKDLLIFWQNHYLQKDKDCLGLEQNSKIDFKYWRHTVELLLNPDSSEPCSLNHYIPQTTNDMIIKKTNKIDDFRSD